MVKVGRGDRFCVMMSRDPVTPVMENRNRWRDSHVTLDHAPPGNMGNGHRLGQLVEFLTIFSYILRKFHMKLVLSCFFSEIV